MQLFERTRGLSGRSHGSSPQSPTIAFDEAGRFRVWANNIGAFLTADRRNSLDFRLRTAAKISSRIIEFLNDLNEALEESKIIVLLSDLANIE